MSNVEPVERRDYLYVGLFTAFLYAVVLAAGGPLTMHEGVLSQTTKAMLSNHDWLAPRYGDAPWLERPPLPQWISCALCTVIGHGDREWNVRVGPALAAGHRDGGEHEPALDEPFFVDAGLLVGTAGYGRHQQHQAQD